MATIIKAAVLGTIVSLTTAAHALTDAEVQAEGERACALVAEELGLEKQEHTIRTVTVRELVPILANELAEVYANLMTETDAAHHALAEARLLAGTLLGKYALETDEILIVPEVLRSMPLSARTDEALQSILVHECTHALAHRQTGFSAQLVNLTSVDRVMAYSSVVEGHAELVAERVCKRAGCDSGLRAVQHSRHAIPDDQPEAVRYILHQLNVRDRFAYENGQRFVRAVYEAQGWGGVWKLYTQPPTSTAEIEQPVWYLKPHKKPKVRVSHWAADIERDFMDLGYEADRRTISRAELRGLFSPLSNDDAATGFVSAEAVTGVTSAGSSVTVVLYEFDARRNAQLHRELLDQLFAARAEQMKYGAVRIEKSTAHDLPCSARAVDVTVVADGQTQRFHNLIASNGRTLYTVTHNEPLDDERACEVASELLPAR